MNSKAPYRHKYIKTYWNHSHVKEKEGLVFTLIATTNVKYVTGARKKIDMHFVFMIHLD